MNLSPQDFNNFLNGIGQSFQWRKSYACPCINQATGSPRGDCLQCDGKGRLWVAPVPGTAGVAGQSVQRKWANFGQYELGDCVVAVGSNSPLYGIGQFDRALMLDSNEEFSLSLIRGARNERLRFPVICIDRVFWLNDSQDIVEGGLPELDADGNPTWPDGGAPPDKTQYSISGRRQVEYYCWGQLPSTRNEHHGLRLPIKCVLRRFDLFGR